MTTEELKDIATLVLRISLGVIFIAHGLQKTFGLFGGSGIEGFAGALKSMGMVAPVFWAWVASLGELAGGIFLLLGIFPRIGAALIAIVMLVAIFKVHGSKGFFAMQGGFEYQFLILMSSISLILTGGGKFSLHDKL